VSFPGCGTNKNPVFPDWGKTLVLALALFLLNFYLCHELFGIEYLVHMGSIEGAFIGLSRYINAHWNDLTWFPLWNAGIPYPTTYPPLLHLVVALVASVCGMSPAHAYHWVTALAYCLGPVALFALTFRISGSRWAGFVAGLIYSSVSTSAWLIPRVGRDLGSPFFSRRLQALVFYGEGPHVSSMTLLTLAVVCLDLAMAKRRAPYLALASVMFAATAVTNWLGAFAIALVVLPYALAHLGPKGWKPRELMWLALIAFAAYGLAMPLMPPSTIAVLQATAKTTGGDYTQAYTSAAFWFPAIVMALVAIKAVVKRRAPHLQFALLFAFLVTLIAMADGLWNIAILPMAVRYHLEMEMALALLVAVFAHAILRKQPRWISVVSLTALVLVLIVPIRNDRRWARTFLIRPIDIKKTMQWKTAQWLNQHWTGERIWLSGSAAYWLTAFSDTPELWGFDQAITDPMIPIAVYTSRIAETRQHAEISVLWLKALGVQAVGVSGPSSTEPYKLFHNPAVFEGVLDPLWNDGQGDVLYRVGEGSFSLARVVPRAALVSRPPIHGLDIDPLRPYVAALQDPRMPRAKVSWSSMHSATIESTLAPDQVISIQIAWQNGWHAIVNGVRMPVRRDAIGLMYVDPKISGPCHIEIVYDGGTERLIARVISLSTMLLLIAASVRETTTRSRHLA
jgi:hypothetical protein